MKAQREAPPIKNHGTRRGWVVKPLPRRFIPRQKTGTNYTGGWVGLGDGLTHFHYISYHPQEQGRIKGRASRAAARGANV
jgi:hypothetical protein